MINHGHSSLIHIDSHTSSLIFTIVKIGVSLYYALSSTIIIVTCAIVNHAHSRSQQFLLYFTYIHRCQNGRLNSLCARYNIKISKFTNA